MYDIFQCLPIILITIYVHLLTSLLSYCYSIPPIIHILQFMALMPLSTLIFNCLFFLLLNRNTWQIMTVHTLHWAHWNPGLNTVCKLASSVWNIARAAITHLHNVCPQQVKERPSLPSVNVSSWMWLLHGSNLVFYSFTVLLHGSYKYLSCPF